MRVRWARRAAADLEEIGDYVARDSPAAAGNLILRILDQTEMLGVHPHRGRPGRIPGTRELVITETPFIAAYRVREGTVEILALFHGARRWPDSLT